MPTPSEACLPLIATRAGRTIGGVTVRILPWPQFWVERPDRRPDNDNRPADARVLKEAA